MSFLASEDFSALDLSTAGAQIYARGAIIGAGARGGDSGATTLGVLQANGLGIRTQDFYQVWGDVKAQVGAGQSANQLNIDASTGEILPGTAPENWTGQYVHQVTATFRTRDDQGNYELSQRSLGIKSTEALSPFQAFQDALGILETPIDGDDEGGYGSAGDLLSLQLTGAWYDTNRSALKGV